MRSHALGYTAAMLKYLRIAVTALSLMVCVLLIALWVRSLRSVDILIGRAAKVPVVGIVSVSGKLVVATKDHLSILSEIDDWEWYSDPRWGGPPKTFLGRFYETREKGLWVPHWFAALMSVVVAAIPWLPGRFSLRTLLIATTLVAVALGVIVAAN